MAPPGTARTPRQVTEPEPEDATPIPSHPFPRDGDQVQDSGAAVAGRSVRPLLRHRRRRGRSAAPPSGCCFCHGGRLQQGVPNGAAQRGVECTPFHADVSPACPAQIWNSKDFEHGAIDEKVAAEGLLNGDGKVGAPKLNARAWVTPARGRLPQSGVLCQAGQDRVALQKLGQLRQVFWLYEEPPLVCDSLALKEAMLGGVLPLVAERAQGVVLQLSALSNARLPPHGAAEIGLQAAFSGAW